MAGAWLWTLSDAEHRRIQAERAERYARFALGLPLDGTPDLTKLDARLEAHGLKRGAPVFMRIFKREFELELWMMRDGRFHRFATYPICRWSGGLGPKFATGDKQAPEGFYTIDAKALNPNSHWHRSFNLGFPNAFDRAYGRSGSFLMVHGGCSSVGCYAMTDPVVTEIWDLATAALDKGQPRFQIQVLPFRLSETNLEQHKDHVHAPFWRSLKPGYDQFEANLLPPKISVCEKRYLAEPAGRVSDGSTPVTSDCSAAGSRQGPAANVNGQDVQAYSPPT